MKIYDQITIEIYFSILNSHKISYYLNAKFKRSYFSIINHKHVKIWHSSRLVFEYKNHTIFHVITNTYANEKIVPFLPFHNVHYPQSIIQIFTTRFFRIFLSTTTNYSMYAQSNFPTFQSNNFNQMSLIWQSSGQVSSEQTAHLFRGMCACLYVRCKSCELKINRVLI